MPTSLSGALGNTTPAARPSQSRSSIAGSLRLQKSCMQCTRSITGSGCGCYPFCLRPSDTSAQCGSLGSPRGLGINPLWKDFAVRLAVLFKARKGQLLKALNVVIPRKRRGARQQALP